MILQTLPGTPSAKSGLGPGDEILAINNYVIGRLDLEQLSQLLTESRQHPAQLDVKRAGSSRTVRLVLIPEEMQSSSVDRTFFIGPGIGYIHASAFDENTGKDIKAAIEKLGGDQMTGLVLDLRDNPGGVVTAALETASLFLQPGQVIFTIRGRSVPEKPEEVRPKAKPYKFKLVVLVNEKTASASEIVSGALQDHDRATIIGDVSYGKGLVQSVYPLSRGRLGWRSPRQLYYTPSGRSIPEAALDIKKIRIGTANPRTRMRNQEFHTDGERPVTGGGGIKPDFIVQPEGYTRLRMALMASGAFTSFATQYLGDHKVDGDFEVSPSLVDQFIVFAEAAGIQPSAAEWATQDSFLRNRIKTDIFNQALGVERGEQVELQRDPLILKALEILGS